MPSPIVFVSPISYDISCKENQMAKTCKIVHSLAGFHKREYEYTGGHGEQELVFAKEAALLHDLYKPS